MGQKSRMSGKGKEGLFGCKGKLTGDAVVPHVREEIEVLKGKGNICASKQRPQWFSAPLWLEIKQCCRMSDQSSSHLSQPGCGISSPSLCSPGGWHKLFRSQPELLPASSGLDFWLWCFWNRASTFFRNTEEDRKANFEMNASPNEDRLNGYLLVGVLLRGPISPLGPGRGTKPRGTWQAVMLPGAWGNSLMDSAHQAASQHTAASVSVLLGR